MDVFKSFFLVCFVIAILWDLSTYYRFRGDGLAWVQIDPIAAAAQQRFLGPLRLEKRANELCVVGMGRCRPVSCRQEGEEVIESIKKRLNQLFGPSPAHPAIALPRG